jgi:hypothetical protein
MNNFMLHVPGLGIEAFNAIKPVAEIGSINFELYAIRTEKTGAELAALIEPVLGPNPEYLLAGVDKLRLSRERPVGLSRADVAARG